MTGTRMHPKPKTQKSKVSRRMWGQFLDFLDFLVFLDFWIFGFYIAKPKLKIQKTKKTKNPKNPKNQKIQKTKTVPAFSVRLWFFWVLARVWFWTDEIRAENSIPLEKARIHRWGRCFKGDGLSWGGGDHIYIYMYACMYVRMYVCMYACAYAHACNMLNTHIYIYKVYLPS